MGFPATGGDNVRIQARRYTTSGVPPAPVLERSPADCRQRPPAPLASDKLFYCLFHSNPDLILRWLNDQPADAAGYSFSAPVLKEREYRLDGLFTPPPQRPDLPAVVLEAQMAADPGLIQRMWQVLAPGSSCRVRWQRSFLPSPCPKPSPLQPISI